jgi:D-alanyl-D-alanine carboxypeptidase
MLTWQCSQDSLEPQFKQDVIDLLTPSEYHWAIIYGYRTLAEQEVLYQAHLAGGPLATAPGNSAHNYGLAVDVQLLVNGQQDWDTNHPGWQWLFAAILPTPRLHSGKAFGDDDHVERLNWREFKNWATTSPPTVTT